MCQKFFGPLVNAACSQYILNANDIPKRTGLCYNSASAYLFSILLIVNLAETCLLTMGYNAFENAVGIQSDQRRYTCEKAMRPVKKKTAIIQANNSAPPKPIKKAKRKLAFKASLPIRHVMPDDQKAIFANHFVVQHENGVFHLMFFQINPPLAIGTPEQRAKTVGNLEFVDAVCSARIVVADELMPKIIQALMTNHGTQRASSSSSGKAVIEVTKSENSD